MASKKNNAPAKAGANPEELEAKKQAEAKAKAEAEAKAKADAEAKAKAQKKNELPNGEFEVKGKKYKLSDRCPAKLQFGGEVFTRKQLLTNEEALKSLVIGESVFVKKV